MTYGIVIGLLLQGHAVQDLARLSAVPQGHIAKIVELAMGLLTQEVRPASMFAFEQSLQLALRELGREILEVVLNSLDASPRPGRPTHVEQAGETYRQRSESPPCQAVSTLFGPITLQRLSYRSDTPGEPSVFPLEASLGLNQRCTPALAERVGFHLGQAGATQRSVLALLEREHGVSMGTGRLRDLMESLSAATAPFRRTAQAGRICELLTQAFAQKGRRRPTLAVGRDGITVGNQPHGVFEVASCATVSVYDRRGRRLGTVSLGFAPQLGQQTMTDELLGLLREILGHWTGLLPQLAYITDAGGNEESFYTRRLCHMRHPVSRQHLKWQRIVDYYHAAQRLTTIAAALNLEEAAAQSWTRRMRKLLKGDNGVFRVLHSAAAMRQCHGIKNKTQAAAYETACSYLRRRSQWMQYAHYRTRGLPIGSGVTEACCKTLFTQRVKLSGMRWKRHGLQIVLNLRMLVLSGVWNKVYAQALEEPQVQPIRVRTMVSRKTLQKAA